MQTNYFLSLKNFKNTESAQLCRSRSESALMTLMIFEVLNCIARTLFGGK